MTKKHQEITAVALLIVLVVLAGYLFLKDQSDTAQIQALNASSTTFTAQVTALTAEDMNLATNLLLLSAPLGLTSPGAPMLVSTKGTLSVSGKNNYSITTPYGVKASVKNSSDSAVAAALRPLVGTTVQFSGTFIPGTPSITLTNVNGTPVQ